MKFKFPRGLFPHIVIVIVGLAVLISGLIVSVTAVLRSTELRRKAAEVQGSQLLFKGPQKVNAGEKFSVDLLLDTAADAQYTISGVDAVVSYQGATLFDVWPGKIFDSYPTQGPSAGVDDDILPKTPPAPPVKTCGGFLGEKCPQGYECVFTDPPTQSDRQGICQITGQRELLNPVTISGVKNYSVKDKGYFNGFTGQGIFATLTFVAQNPGKATINLVYNSPSATDDTNINGFLANQPVSLQKPQERLLTAPQTFAVEVVAPQPTPTSSPTCVPRPPCADGIKDANGRIVICDPAPGVQWCPTPKPTITPTPSPTPQPTPTPSSRVIINFQLNLEGRTNHATKVDLYGLLKGSVNIEKLGSTRTDSQGKGNLELDSSYSGRTYHFFAQTPSHLRKEQQKTLAALFPCYTTPCERPQNIDFGTLTAGDIYTDDKGTKDNLINTFDVAAMYSSWSGANTQIRSGFFPVTEVAVADLNGDGVVNNRDLAMLLSNFGKKGDPQSGISTAKEGSFAGVLKPAGPNIYQWGTHTLTIKDGTVYQVRGAKELLTRYQEMQVVVSGTLEYIQLEGGFWGLTAKGVVVE